MKHSKMGESYETKNSINYFLEQFGLKQTYTDGISNYYPEIGVLTPIPH